jgi:hypothetical protein
MRAFVEGVGLVGPGLQGWQPSRAVLAGERAYSPAAICVAASALLPAAERRRAGMPVRLALAAGLEAIDAAGLDAATLATVFASSSGDCDNVHEMCVSLATPERQVSPTRFHNSVHNAAAGYWSIATQCREPSTSLCGHDASFAMGLLEAASQVCVDGNPVLLIAYDHPYPAPLNAARPIGGAFGAALVLTAKASGRSIAALDIEFEPRSAVATAIADGGLQALASSVPAGRGLPLLAALARSGEETVALEYVAGTHLRVAVTACS